MIKLPEEIQVSRHMYYDVQDIAKSLIENDERTIESVTLEEVLDVVLAWAYDDFATLTDFEPIVTDLEGNILN